MLNYENVKEYLATFIDVNKDNEKFDYNIKEKNQDYYTKELHKFNNLYGCYFMSSNRLIFGINNYEVGLPSDKLKHLVNLYNYYSSIESNNALLIAEFLLSYYNSINTKEYQNNVSDYKNIRNDFREIIIKPNKNIIENIKNDANKIYNLIIDYGLNQDDFFLGDILERSCINFKKDPKFKSIIIQKFLKNNLYIPKVIEYDDDLQQNLLYYSNYIEDFKNENVYSRFSDNIFFILDSRNLLSYKLFDIILNKIIDRINDIHEKSLDKNENFIYIMANIDETIKVLNSYLNKIKNLNQNQKNKIHECLENVLYIKRCILSDQDRINSQMQKFKYEQIIPNEEIEMLVSSITKNIGSLYTVSCGNFLKKLGLAIQNYSEYPTTYIFSSYDIDSEMQVYLKSNDKIEKSVFKEYYDKKGVEYSQEHPELINVLAKDHYQILIKYLKQDFVTNNRFILLFFNAKLGNRSLVENLISRGNYKIHNDYVILAMNVSQIENGIVKILKSKGLKITKNGFTNLNELASIYKDDDIYFNGLMYINYILYEKHGLNIRNNISHGNYFKRNIEIEVMTTFCAIMFLNNLIRKECGDYD